MASGPAHDEVLLRMVADPRPVAGACFVGARMALYLVAFSTIASLAGRRPAADTVAFLPLFLASPLLIVLWEMTCSPAEVVLTKAALVCRWRVLGWAIRVETPLGEIQRVSFGRGMPYFARDVFVHRAKGRALRFKLLFVTKMEKYPRYHVTVNRTAKVFGNDGEGPNDTEAFADLVGAVSGAPVDPAISPRGLPLTRGS